MCEVEVKFLGISCGFSSEHFESQSEHASHCCHIFVLHLSFCFICVWINGFLLTRFTAVWHSALNGGAVTGFTV